MHTFSHIMQLCLGKFFRLLLQLAHKVVRRQTNIVFVFQSVNRFSLDVLNNYSKSSLSLHHRGLQEVGNTYLECRSYLANVLVVAACILLLQEKLVPHPTSSHSFEQLLSPECCSFLSVSFPCPLSIQ